MPTPSLQQGVRSSSANYLVAHVDGVAVDVEARPATSGGCSSNFPEDGVVLHTNHFRSPAFDGKDVSLWVMPDSPFRLERLRTRRPARRRDGLSLDTFRGAPRRSHELPLRRVLPSRRTHGPARPGRDGGLGADGPRREADVGRRRSPVHGPLPRARLFGASSPSRPPSSRTGRHDIRCGFGLITCQRAPGGDAKQRRAVRRRARRSPRRPSGLGFDSVWVCEHHFVDDGYLPSLLPMCAAIAARTERGSRSGTALLLAPLYEPLRLAEDAAVVDLISGGRLILGVRARLARGGVRARSRSRSVTGSDGWRMRSRSAGPAWAGERVGGDAARCRRDAASRPPGRSPDLDRRSDRSPRRGEPAGSPTASWPPR